MTVVNLALRTFVNVLTLIHLIVNFIDYVVHIMPAKCFEHNSEVKERALCWNNSANVFDSLCSIKTLPKP